MQISMFDAPVEARLTRSEPTTERVSATVLSLLRAAAIENNTLQSHRLPQMERDVYEEFNEVLVRLRGKWKRGKGHVFPYDPTTALAAVVESGRMPAKNPLAYFPTPPELAAEIVAGLDVAAPKFVLEPSAGDGALVRAARERWPDARITAVELDPLNVAMLANTGAAIIDDDFLAVSFGGLRFDVVVMNPPFVVGDDKVAWETHLRRAVELLAPGGALACVAPSGSWRGSTQKRFKALRSWLAGLGADVREHDPGAFSSSGTGVSTCTITIRDGAEPVDELVWVESAEHVRIQKQLECQPEPEQVPDLDEALAELWRLHVEADKAMRELMATMSDIPGLNMPDLDEPDDQEWLG